MTPADPIVEAIERLDATDDERDALLEIYSIEGFGGREDRDPPADVAADRLVWLRDQRSEEAR